MGLRRLSAPQRALVDEWLPGVEVVADLSWNQVDTVVLRVRAVGAEYIVKAGGSHHLLRELEAHADGWTDVWTLSGRAARLRHASRDERVLVLDYLPGTLPYGTPAGLDPTVHRRAGALLRAFHDQASRPSEGTDAAATARAIAWLDGAHRIDAGIEARARAALAAWEPREEPLVPTHGDWQPRNWLVDGDPADPVVRVIDLGRFAFRSAATDLARLAAQEWRENPECEAAFLDGYGGDPRHPSHWRLLRLREAIGTAAWAYQVGDEVFEAQGHRMLAEALAGFDG